MNTTFTAPGKVLILPRPHGGVRRYPQKRQEVRRTYGNRPVTVDLATRNDVTVLGFEKLSDTQAQNLRDFIAHVDFASTPFDITFYDNTSLESVYYESGIDTLRWSRGDLYSVRLTLKQGSGSDILLGQNLILNPNFESTDGTVDGITHWFANDRSEGSAITLAANDRPTPEITTAFQHRDNENDANYIELPAAGSLDLIDTALCVGFYWRRVSGNRGIDVDVRFWDDDPTKLNVAVSGTDHVFTQAGGAVTGWTWQEKKILVSAIPARAIYFAPRFHLSVAGSQDTKMQITGIHASYTL